MYLVPVIGRVPYVLQQYTLCIYLVYNRIVHVPGMTLLPVRKCKRTIYIRIHIKPLTTFPDKLGIARLQAVKISAREAAATQGAGSGPPTSSNRNPQGTHEISSPQKLGQQQQLSFHQHRDPPCDEPPLAEEGLPTAIATQVLLRHRHLHCHRHLLRHRHLLHHRHLDSRRAGVSVTRSSREPHARPSHACCFRLRWLHFVSSP